MKLSRNYKIFLGIITSLFLLNLLVANDVALLWDGPEAWRFWKLNINETTAKQLFFLRLPGGIFIVLTLFTFWFLGKRIFGAKPALLTGVVLGVSLLIPNLAKQAILDSWLLFFQTSALLGLVLYLKQPKTNWLLLFVVALCMGVWLQPLGTCLTFFLLSLGLGAFHPNGKRLLIVSVVLGLTGLISAFLFRQHLDWATATYFIGYFQRPFYKNWFFQLAGFLPFSGFIFSGLWEAYQKVSKREEFSIILLVWLLAALMGQSLLFSLGLALMVAKQMEAYFIPQYPYRSIVKTGAILHAVGAFLGITFLLMGGFYQFKGTGFRAGLAFGALYWMPAFVAIIGLYGMNRRFVLGGTITGAALATLFFWLQLYPLLQTRLKWQEEQMTAIESKVENQEVFWMYWDPKAPFPALGVQARQSFEKVNLIRQEAALQDALTDLEKRPLLIPFSEWEKDTTRTPALEVEGWNSVGLSVKRYMLLLRSSDK